MINKEEFEFHKSIIDWLVQNGLTFIEAMTLLSYADQIEKSLPICFYEVFKEQEIEKEKIGKK